MNTKKKSDAIKFLEDLSGRPLNFGAMIESIRMSEEESQISFFKSLILKTRLKVSYCVFIDG